MAKILCHVFNRQILADVNVSTDSVESSTLAEIDLQLIGIGSGNVSIRYSTHFVTTN